MGCAVACVASLLNITYSQAHALFTERENAWTRGFYCSEVVQALAQIGQEWNFKKFDPAEHLPLALRKGTIVFIAANSNYPMGHFLLRKKTGWMNPWSNFPQMIPVEAAIQEDLPGEISYLIFSKQI